MKSGSAHSSNLIHRWLSRTSDTATTTFEDDSDVELRSNSFSPPPLTDSSSTAASVSTILTPTTSVAQSPPHWKSYAPAKAPCPPPTRHTKLPVVLANHKPQVSSVASHPSAVVLARTDIKLHRFLNHDPTRRALMFDISLPSSFIRQYPPASTSNSSSMSIVVRRPLPVLQPRPITTPRPISEHDLSQPATTPPVTRLHIICDLIPWAIDVRGRTILPNDPRSFVRIIDVLDGIYTSLRTGVTGGEWSPTEGTFRDQVKKAHSRRCHASRPFSLTGYEEKQGVRRIDYLQDNTMFLGLTIKTPGRSESDRTQGSEADGSAWVMMVGQRLP